jgi:ribonuclease P protein component
MALCRAARLATRERIAALRRHGRRAQGASGSLWVLPSSSSTSRLAVAVPRRLGTAVARNRVRRRLQAHFGRLSATWAEPWDIYFLARAAAMDRSFAALGEAFAALLEQADVR